MLNTIKISVEKPVITAPNISHISTSYQVSTTPTFNVVKNLVLNIAKTTVGLLEYVFTHRVRSGVPLYLRTRTHNSDGSTSPWSPTTEINVISPIPVYINTRPIAPVVTITVDYVNTPSGELVIGVGGVLTKTGSGSTTGITWLIKTTNGDILYKKIYTTDLTPQLRLPLPAMVSDIIMCNVILHNDTGNDSNIGQGIHVLSKSIVSPFAVTLHDRLYNNSVNRLSISQHDKKYISSDVQITTLAGALILNLTGLNPYTPGFRTPNMVNATYVVKTRLKTQTGVYTPWVECYIGDVFVRDVRSYNPSIPYESVKSYFNTHMLTSSHQMTTTDEDDVFYMLTPGTNTLRSYVDVGGVIYPGSQVFNLPNNVVTKDPVVNILRLHQGRLLVDVNVDTGTSAVSTFFLLGVNHITKSLNLIKSYSRTDEPVSTGMCGSAAVRSDDLIYYIPGKISNNNDLELRIYNINTNKVTSKLKLPIYNIKENVTMTTDVNGDIYIFGGSSSTTDNTIVNFLNNNVYKLNKTATAWIHVGVVSVDEVSAYRYRMVTLEDGNFLIINTTPTTAISSINNEYLFNPKQGNQLQLPVKYDITKPTPNGSDIIILSGSVNRSMSVLHVTDPVSRIPPVGKIMPLNPNVKDLIVPTGKIIYLRDAGRYNTITINGSNMSNSGVLVYIRNGVPEKYYYNDLIVTKDTAIPADAIYNNLLILNNSTVTAL